MTFRTDRQQIDWSKVKLVVFDVDGTLYDQKALRLRMARDILIHAMLTRSLGTLSVIKTYRQIRERLGEAELENFKSRLISETAATTGFPEDEVLALTREWIEDRPLAYLESCRFPHLIELFAGLKFNGKSIGIFSDYPAHRKLESLGLAADYIVSAEDDGIGLLKPHPKGLERLMAEAGVTEAETLLVGDRAERDGIAARRAGVRCLIKSAKPRQDWHTFAHFNEPLFESLL